MTVKEFSQKAELKFLCNEKEAENRQVNGCYCGDLLSWVMSRAKENNIWLTVMGNINAVGVAVLTDVSCIILTENAPLDEQAEKKANENGVIILTTEKTSYEISALFSKLQ